jgi:putative transposase
MPNHVHGIVVLEHDPASEMRRAPLSEVVRGFKTYAARRVNGLRGIYGNPLWQRNYYERIIRDDRKLENVRKYIAENPMQWSEDSENPLRHAEANVPTPSPRISDPTP